MTDDFSEPECSTCFRYRTSGVLTTQISEPPSHAVISITPVQDLGHDSALTLSPSQVTGDENADVASTSGVVTTQEPEPPTNAVVSVTPVQDLGSDSTVSPVHSSSPFAITSSVPVFGYTPPEVRRSIPGPEHDFQPGESWKDFGNIPSFGDYAARARSVVSFGVNPSATTFSNSSLPNSSTSTVVFGTTPVSVSSLFGPAQHSPNTNSVSVSSASSCFPGFGVGYLPGSSSNVFSPFGRNSTVSPGDYGFSTATTQLPSSSSSSLSTTCSSTLNIGPLPFASPEQGRLASISASNLYQHKSHEELRWEDYKQGDKGGSRLNTALHSRFVPFGSFSAGVTTSSSSPFGQAPTAFASFPPAFVATSSSSPFGQAPTAFASFPPASVTPSSSSPSGQATTPPAGVTPSTSSPSVQATTAFASFPPAGVTPSSPSPFNQASTAFASFLPPGVTTSLSSPFGQTNGAFTGYGPMFSSAFSPPYTTVPAAYMPPLNWGAPQPLFNQRPHATAALSFPGCTACGATTTSSSAYGHFNFNGATMPPSAATYLPGSRSVMFGTTFVAYPAQSFVLLPFSAMSLQ